MDVSLMNFVSNDFVICPASKKIFELKDELVYRNELFVIAMDGLRVINVFSSLTLLKIIFRMGDIEQKLLYDSYSLTKENYGEKFSIVTEKSRISDLKGVESDIAVIVNDNGFPIGIINDLKMVVKCLNYVDAVIKENKDTLFEFQRIFEFIDEEIFVTDKNGYVLRLNPAAEKICGVKAADVIGKHVKDLERKKIISSSITMEVLKQKRKVNMLQTLYKTGKTVLAQAVPVFDEKGKVIRVICTSKDVDEIVKLKHELEERRTELALKDQELKTLREEMFKNIDFICNSGQMNAIKDSLLRIAPKDLTVLIQGESGVGKEVVAKTIHLLSNRKEGPFIKINCGLIPENLIETELFGYEKGAFTGADKSGKIGKIELANRGTLFLDEIGEMPLHLQVKLLEFLQDMEICRVGGTRKIKIDTRIIAATNRDLQKMIKENQFRQDLYYRLNVLQIVIPPLKERKDDIPVLAKYFVSRLNRKYNTDKMITPEAIEFLMSYDWPGNVRELEHAIERAMVTSETANILPHHFDNIFCINRPARGEVICTGLIPLKLAKRELEKKLVEKAYETYKSTYKVAKILEIDQSTVVKLLKKYR